MTPASADDFARPMPIPSTIAPTAPSLPGLSQSPAPQALKSPRKVRSDKGILKGPYKPRQPTRGTLKGDYWEIPLRGVHGEGKVLKVNPEDYELLMEMSENGTRLYVVPDASGCLTVRLRGQSAACFADNSNPDHCLPVTRFLTGERHGGLVLRHINHDPMDCRRANLIHEVKAKKTRHPIDWEKAQRKREERMEVVRAAQAPQAPLFS
ncbi:hypothetical protein [Gluconobacter sp. P5B12]|uniref:hypothetical protein n=1 Tax=Gluconobacter sp. P5B12 TaxID=2762618 RepID=UPI00207B180D|nr:hypothetical protein [Gluconobacter sp. P5B12]